MKFIFNKYLLGIMLTLSLVLGAQAQSYMGDNLGNHIATKQLNMKNNNVTNVHVIYSQEARIGTNAIYMGDIPFYITTNGVTYTVVNGKTNITVTTTNADGQIAIGMDPAIASNSFATLTGFSMSGNIDMGNHSISNISNNGLIFSDGTVLSISSTNISAINSSSFSYMFLTDPVSEGSWTNYGAQATWYLGRLSSGTRNDLWRYVRSFSGETVQVNFTARYNGPPAVGQTIGLYVDNVNTVGVWSLAGDQSPTNISVSIPNVNGSLYFSRNNVDVWDNYSARISNCVISWSVNKSFGGNSASGFTVTGPLNVSAGSTGALILTQSGTDILIGNSAIASNRGIAVGNNANTDMGISIGNNATSSYESIAIGRDARAMYQAGGRSVAIGPGANAYALSIQIGGGTPGQAASSGSGSTVVGINAEAYNNAIAVGYNANASGWSIAMGHEANSRNDRGIAIGYTANGDQYGVAIGYSANAAVLGTAVGSAGVLASNNAVALGYGAKAGPYSIAIGSLAGNQSNYTILSSKSNIMVGAFAVCNQLVTNSIALGNFVSNDVSDSVRMRGALYLDGAAGVFTRPTFNSGTWNALSPYSADTGSVGSVVYSAFSGNSISSTSHHSQILGGTNNSVDEGFGGGTIVGGYGNKIINSNYGGWGEGYSFIGGGKSNAVSGGYAAVVMGQDCVAGYRAFVGSGYGNKAYAAGSVICGGGWWTGHEIGNSSVAGFIGGGRDNVIGVASTDSIIVGGLKNSMGNNLALVSILGGQYNSVASGAYGLILEGSFNYIGSRDFCAIMQGNHNRIEFGAYSSYDLILNGYYNKVEGSQGGGWGANTIVNGFYNYNHAAFGFIGSGYYNAITNGFYTSIINGYSNVINATTNCTILAGSSNLISGAVNSTILGGNNVIVTNSHVLAFGTGAKSTASSQVVFEASSGMLLNGLKVVTERPMVIAKLNDGTNQVFSALSTTILAHTYAVYVKGTAYNTNTFKFIPGISAVEIGASIRLSPAGNTGNTNYKMFLMKNGAVWKTIWDYTCAENGERPLLNPYFEFYNGNATDEYQMAVYSELVSTNSESENARSWWRVIGY